MTLLFTRLLAAVTLRWRRVTAAFVLLALLPAVQAATYSFRSDAYAWETATTQVTWDTSCTQYPGDDDKATIAFTGGFTFTFAGTAYNSVRVLTNGLLQFGSDTGLFRDYTNDAMPIGTAPTRSGCTAGPATNVLAAYWTDLDPSRAGSGKVYWQQKGTAPNRYVVISWSGVYQYSTTKPYTFQVILYENGEFKYQYGAGNTSGLNATIGVQVSSADYTQYAYNNGYTAAGTAIRWYIASTTPAKVAEYRMDETSWTGTVGEVLDSSGNSHNGVRVGGSSQTTAAGGGYVCRAFEVPSNTSTTIAAVDTALDVDSAIGPSSGSVSLWYRANVRWNTNNNAAMLVDATALANRPFYLQRNDNGALRFMLSDLAGTTLVATTGAQSFAANTWVHVAATWSLKTGTNQSTVRIYINGVQAATTTGTTLGSLDVSLGTLFIGDNRSTNTPTGATTNSANGRIDEVRLYNYEVGAAQVATDMATTHGCGVTLDHVEISGDDDGLTCTPSTFTVIACQDAACATRYSEGVTGTLTATGSVNWPDGASFSIPSGSSSANLRMQLPSPGSVTLGTTGLAPAPTGLGATTTCNLGGTGACVYTAADSGLVYDVPHHRADTPQAVSVSAVKKSDTSSACVPAFASVTKTVAFSCSFVNPVSGTLPVRVNSSAVSCGSGSVSLSLAFNASGMASTAVQYADVGKVTLAARYPATGTDAGLVMTGSDDFVAAPAAALVLSGLPVNPVGAGNPFTLTVEARNANNAATANFGKEATPQLSLTHVLRAPTGMGVSNPSLTTSWGAFSGGAGLATLRWPEVGWLDVTATVTDYLGSGLSSIATTVAPAGKLAGVQIVPHHFDVSLAAVNGHGCGSFTYAGWTGGGAGQAFQVDVTARNASNITTANYDGSLTSPVSRSVTLTEASALGGSLSGGPHAPAGTFVAGLSRNVSASYLFAAKETAPGTLVVGATDGDASSASGSPVVQASVPLRSGRLRLANGFGSEKQALQLQATTEYFTASRAWVKNADDSCTTVAATAVARSNVRDGKGAAATWTTTPALITITGGSGTLSLSAPLATGSLDLALNLGSTTADQSCLSTHPSTTGAGKPWLRSRNGSCAAGWAADPSARASFGIYSPETQKTVHAREIF
ncbi:LamG domain-containing protein [Ideonella sp. BN130291]|uniref:LamG domain-containing protein n=1 Tax=Ideonella sp. BN130291 TaxID=3112940 RepID=UPI002E262FBC|nr:LamG domain-containing protein [Ideonella sp. BN130291]